MKKLFPLSLFTLILFIITACSKDKRAAFELDKTEYIQGETIKTTNTTVKGSKFYRWNFGGTEIYEKEPVFVLPKDQAPGEFIISCEATNSKNSSSSGRSSSKTVMVKEASQGKLIFWNPGSNFVSIAIKIYGSGITNKYDTITYSNSSNPSCNYSSDNAVFLNLKAGTYSYTAHDLFGSSTENGDITLKDGFDCQSVQIF